MREIKFCGKRLDNGEWVEGYYNGCYETVTIDYLKNGIPWNVCVDPASVGQYLGIEDKNGNEIFDNSIVKLPMVDGGKGDIATFKFDAPNYHLVGKKGTYNISAPHNPECYEVIGIYENPELLGAEK